MEDKPPTLEYAGAKSRDLVLTPDERYFLAYYRSSRVNSNWLAWLVARCMIAGFFIFGLVIGDQAVLFGAFGTLLAFDLFGATKQPASTRILCSAIDKLENRIAQLEQERQG